MAELATKDSPLPAHVLEVVAQRSGGNPQFLRDLLRFAIQSGGIVGLPDSAEAAALARIDALSPEDRAVVRRAAVFGLTFHPRMLAWFDGEDDPPPPPRDTCARLSDLFDEDGEGYLRFRQSLLRDTAYEGLPFKLRRRLHAVVAAHVEEEADQPGRGRGHPVAALRRRGRARAGVALRERSPRRAPRRPTRSSKPRTCTRARSRRAASCPSLRQVELGRVQESLGDAWFQAARVPQGARRLHDGAGAGRRRAAARGGPAAQALARRGEARPVLRRRCAGSSARARRSTACRGSKPRARTRRRARGTPPCCRRRATRPRRCKWAEQAAREGEEIDDPEVTGDAYMVMGWGYSVAGQGRRRGDDAEVARSRIERSGNRVRAGEHPVEPRRPPATGTAAGTTRCPTTSAAATSSIKVGNLLNRGDRLAGHRRDPERPRRARRGRVDAAADAAGVEGLGVPLLPRLLHLDAGPRVAAREQDRRGARALRRGASRS